MTVATSTAPRALVAPLDGERGEPFLRATAGRGLGDRVEDGQGDDRARS